MSELNQEYGETVDRLDSWVKSYIEEVCISFDPSRIKLYWEKPKGNASKVKWGFSVEGSMKKEGSTIITEICSELLQERISSLVGVDELNEILKYIGEKENAADLYDRLKKALFEKLEDGRLIRYYLKRVMKELPDKEIFVQLSALNYEKRVTHTHLVFDTNGEFFRFGEKSIIFDRAMDFELEKVRLIRKLMEISRENFGLVVQKDAGKWYVKGSVPLESLKDMYQIEIVGHSVWKLKHGQEELLEYKAGVYTLPSVESVKSVYEKEFKKLEQIISDKTQRNNIKSAINKIREIATHGTGMIFIEEAPVTEGEISFIDEEIDRLESFGKAYAIREKVVDLSKKEISSELLNGITAIDGALFCNFNLECKAIGVIVDGETVKAGDPGRGARYNSLTNYVRWLNSENRNANVNCMAVVISEDGTLDIEISKPRN